MRNHLCIKVDASHPFSETGNAAMYPAIDKGNNRVIKQEDTKGDEIKQGD